jgi:hypothetical protein
VKLNSLATAQKCFQGAIGEVLFAPQVRSPDSWQSWLTNREIKGRWAVEAKKLQKQSDAHVVVHRPKLDTLFETKKAQIVRVEKI